MQTPEHYSQRPVTALERLVASAAPGITAIMFVCALVVLFSGATLRGFGSLGIAVWLLFGTVTLRKRVKQGSG